MIKITELILKRKGNWVLKRYSYKVYGKAKRTYWVMKLPHMNPLLQFNNLKKAKEYFKSVTK